MAGNEENRLMLSGRERVLPAALRSERPVVLFILCNPPTPFCATAGRVTLAGLNGAYKQLNFGLMQRESNYLEINCDHFLGWLSIYVVRKQHRIGCWRCLKSNRLLWN